MHLCTDCEARDGELVSLWVAGGDRIGDYHEDKIDVCLCEQCECLYAVCEACGDLIADEVSVPRGEVILCPACREKE